MAVQKKQPDFALFAITVILLAIGVFMVYDASYVVATQRFHNGKYFFYRQAIFSIIGLVVMYIAMNLPYWRLRPYASLLLGLSIVGLVAVFIPGIGKETNGATRWIPIAGQQVQPSEFAKLFLIVYLAATLSAKRREIMDLEKGLIPILLPIVVITFLIVKEDMGTAIVVGATAFAMIYMAGAQPRHLAGILLAVSPFALFMVLHKSYRMERLIAFVDPFKDYHGIGYQVCQSLIALGSGGFFGVGLCESRQKLFYLPEGHTDFIYAVLGQETGLIGTTLLVVLFFLLAIRGIKIAAKAKDDFGRLLAAGISIMIAGQALLNMLVVTSSVPATGVPLPFISYGGSSLTLNLLCVGIILSVSQHQDPPPVRRERRG